MTQEHPYSERVPPYDGHQNDFQSNGNSDVRGYYTHHEPSLGELFSDLSRESSMLLREEIRLAQVEMTHKAKKAGSAAAMLAAGGFIAYAGFLFLLLALTFGLSYFMWDWLAALIVGGLVAVIGGFMVASNLDKLKQINPAPQQTIESLQEDKEWLKEQMK
jgi:hypothetical protein